MKKTEILMNKLAHLGLSILEISQVSTYEFSHECIKPKYDEKAKLCTHITVMDANSFIVHVKVEYVYEGIAK